MSASLKGQVAIITGGTRGIGRATAELFAAEGASIALCSRDQAALDEATQALKAKYGVDAVGIAADILDAGAMKQFVDDVGTRFGRIDILVNNAGGSEQRQASGSRQQVYAVDPLGGAPLPPGRFEEMTNEEFLNWQQSIDRHGLAGLRTTRLQQYR
jgi:3-oxoacyl-[acyl-carrier protein] reductase